MTDLIARLEEHIAMHEEGVREQDDAKLCLCDLADDLPAFLHALKVQQAAETGVRADERREMQKAVAEAMAWSEHHRLQHGGCEWAVKGEQP